MAADKIDDKATTAAAGDQQQQQPPKDTKTTALGEDDEFEDFPVDGASTNSCRSLLSRTSEQRGPKKLTKRLADWPEDQTEAAQGSGQTKHLWEESWDDDDTTDDFSTQLKCVDSCFLATCRPDDDDGALAIKVEANCA